MSRLHSDETLALRAERSTHTIFYDHNTTPLTNAALVSARKLVEVAGRVIRAGQSQFRSERHPSRRRPSGNASRCAPS